MNQKLKIMFNAIAVMSEQDILAIHGIVSDSLKAQIEQSYPHLFGSKQFDFSELNDVLEEIRVPLPFMVGYGMVEEKDRNKSLVVHSCYRIEYEKNDMGYTVIRFIKK